MKSWLRGRWTGLITFLFVAILVIGGLGWVTAEALRMEQSQAEDRAEKELNARLRLALWRMDSRVWPALAQEDSRPYNHYSAFYAPSVAFRNDGKRAKPGVVVEPSPLLNADLPDWILLHFQADGSQDPKSAWMSPQVLDNRLKELLQKSTPNCAVDNVTGARQQELSKLSLNLTPRMVLGLVQENEVKAETTLVPADNNDPLYGSNSGSTNPTSNSQNRAVPQQDYSQNNTNYRDEQIANYPPEQKQQIMNRNAYLRRQERFTQEGNPAKAKAQSQTEDASVALYNIEGNGCNWFAPGQTKTKSGKETVVKLGPMVPLWLQVGSEERLVRVRRVKVGDKEVCQGILLDWCKLQKLLAAEVAEEELFPQAKLVPVHDKEPARPERTMTALPVELDPGPAPAVQVPAWTPLRFGLALAWVAALVALGAVGLGGWSLIDLSERRIRFVSAVTHELRTPLTTLRLYLDMMTGGLVSEEKQRGEYLQTLHEETDRLHRLVGNVLDFSRLENQRPRLEMTSMAPADLLGQVHSNWQGRCQSSGKELVVECQVDESLRVKTDVNLIQQILGNLVDNACKYSREAEDPRIWLRARQQGSRLLLEVEDRGPGVARRESRSIFRAFRRGHDADVTAGGVGLGLALAQRWANLVGGRLSLCSETKSGACFRLELPL